jgi:hypothetical protein
MLRYHIAEVTSPLLCIPQVQREREVKETYDKWRAELEEKQRSFEAARSQLLGPKWVDSSQLLCP